MQGKRAVGIEARANDVLEEERQRIPEMGAVLPAVAGVFRRGAQRDMDNGGPMLVDKLHCQIPHFGRIHAMKAGRSW